MFEKPDTPEQKALKENIRAQYPYLITNEDWVAKGRKPLSRGALASKNIKLMLRHNFPGVDFSCRFETYSGGSSVYIHWDIYGNAPNGQQVDALVDAIFSTHRFDGMTDSTSYDRDEWRDAFRSLFGSAGYVVTQGRHLTPEEIAQLQAHKIESETKKVKRHSPGRRL